MNKWNEWINNKYLEYRGPAIGNEKSITEFAEEYIGVPQQVMDTWLKGTKPRKYEYIVALIKRYGDEIYDILEMKKPDKRGQVITALEILQNEEDQETEEFWNSIHKWLSEHGFIRTG